MFDAEDVPYRRLDGSMSVGERRSVVEWLSEGEESKILLVSLRAGGVGLNMVAANRVYFMDLWWNPAVEAQAEQRCHRIGQKKDVHVFKFIAQDSIDERILHLQSTKEYLVSDALTLNEKQGDGAGESASKLNWKDIAYLFNMKL